MLVLCVVSPSISVGVVCCFFFNYCWCCVLFLLRLVLVLCFVSSSISVGVVCCFFLH